MTKKKTDHDDSADLRKRAEEALRQAEENFRRSLDESPLGMRIVSADGETLYANRAILDIYGYAGIEELKTTPIKKRYTPESYAEFQIRLEKRRRGEYLPSKYEVSIVRKNGEVRHLQVFRKETFWNGEAQYQVLYDDITERKRAEEALRESEERYRRLVETAPEVIYNLSAEDGTITLLNPAFERITGWSRAEWLGKPFMPLVHPDDLTLAMETFQQVSRGEATPPYELRILSKSGEYFIGEFTSFPHIEKRKVIGEFGIARDITERKKAEKEIQNLAKFPSENPNPVLRIARDGLLLYVNEAGVRQLADLHLQVGRATPPMLREVVFQVMENGSAQVLDLEHRERAYSFFVAPVVDAGYADLYGLDITERKRAEAELIEREGFNFALFEYNPIQTVVVDLEGKVIKFNLAKKKSGDRLPNIGDTMYKDYAGKHKIDMYPELMKCIRSGEEKEFPEQKYGDRVLSTTISPFPKGAVIISEDITERKRAEEALQESEEKYRNLVERANDGIVIVQDGIVKYINARLAEMRGVTIEEVIGTPFTDQIYPDELPEVVDRYKQRMAGKDVPPIYEIALRRRDGSKIHTELNAGIVTYQGKPADLVIIRDITERKRAEEALRESKEFAENLIGSMLDGISVLDSDGVHIDVNATLCQMTGFSREELIGVGLPHPYWPPEAYEEIETAFQKTLRGDFSDLELAFMRKNGERFPVIVSPSWIKDKQGNVISYFATVKDITERKRAEEEKRRLEERSRKVVEDIFRFIPEGVLVFSRKMELLRQNQAFRELVSGYARRLGFDEDELENLIIDKIKAGLGDKNIKEIRISRKHETGK